MFKVPARLQRLFAPPAAVSAPPVILPDAIRYAFQYDHGQLLPAEVRGLTQPQHQDGAIYLTLKLLHGAPEAQRQLLAGLLRGEAPGALVEQGLAQVAADRKVDGRKLAQLSRQGFSLWDACYRKLAQESLRAAAPQPQGTVALVAYATGVGLRPLIEELRPHGRAFYFVLPQWVADGQQSLAGFRIVPGGPACGVTLCSKQELVRTPLTLLDDTVRTGLSRDALLKLWADGFDASRPLFRTLDVAPSAV